MTIQQFNISNFSLLLLNQTYRKISNSHVEKIIIYAILFVISSVGNASFLYGLRQMKKRKNFHQIKSRIHSLFINLCIGDLMVNFFFINFYGIKNLINFCFLLCTLNDIFKGYFYSFTIRNRMGLYRQMASRPICMQTFAHISHLRILFVIVSFNCYYD